MKRIIMPSLLKIASFGLIFAVGIYFLKQYMLGPMCLSDARIDGKVVLVTGANTGIGRETVRDLVVRGGKIYMGCRSLDRCNAARNDIAKETGQEKNLVVMKLDLGSMASVRSFAKEFKQREQKLDILINNAGVMLVPFSHTEDGFETTFGVNHLGHFLLTNLLVDTIVAAAPSRIITVSARAYMLGSMQFDNLMPEETDYSRLYSYSNSKLANILFSAELARKLEGTGVTTYSLHPGVIFTELGRHLPDYINNPVVQPILGALIYPFIKDIPHGAQTQICCAVDPGLAKETGKYYSDCGEQELLPHALSRQDASKLWEVSVSLVKLTPQEMSKALR